MIIFIYKLEITNCHGKGSTAMLAFLMENIGTIAISILLAAVVAAVVRGMIRDRKAGKGCGGCAGCSGSSGCGGSAGCGGAHTVNKAD